MFGKKQKSVTSFDDKLNAAKYECIYAALKDVLKMEVKGTDTSGKEVINHAATVSSIKTRARLALEFVANLEKSGDDDN